MTTALLHSGILLYALSVGLAAEAIRRHDRKWRRGALLTLLGGALLHLGILVVIGTTQNRFPVGHLHEAVLLLSSFLALATLLLHLAKSVPLLVFGTTPLCLLSGLWAAALASVVTNDPDPQTLLPVVGIHVLAAILALGLFSLSFISATLYLIESSRLKSGEPPPSSGWIAPLDRLYRILRSTLFGGLLLLTAGILVGYLYARSVQTGNDWRMDVKIWFTTFTWVGYALVGGLSFHPFFKGRRTAKGTVICFLLVVATLWTSILWTGFHRFG